MTLPGSLWRPPVVDVVFAVALAALLTVNLALDLAVRQGVGSIKPVAYPLTILAAMLLAWRRVVPERVLGGVVLLQLAQSALGVSPNASVVIIGVALFTVAAQRDRRTALVAFAVLLAAAALAGALVGANDEPSIVARLGVISLGFLPVLLGDTWRSRQAARAELTERLRVAEESKATEAKAAVEAERVRIARDLHDVVAHSIATINLQAGVAAHVIDDQPDQAKQALIEIRDASKAALAELRATLRVLRQDGDEHPTDPSPTLDSIASLVERSATGAELVVLGSPAEDIDPVVAVAGYRIVQEALTNVMKHADGSAVAITLDYQPTSIGITVVDDGTGSPDPAAPPGSGLGLVGFQERASSVGGRVEAGRRFDGSFEVAATLPYTPEVRP